MNLLRRRRLATGKVYPLKAAAFAGGSTQFLGIADNASLSMGAGVRLTMCFWAYPQSLAALQFPVGKVLAGVAATSEYWVRVNNSTSKFDFLVSSGSANQSVASSTTIAVNTWYFVTVYYDGVNIGISLNNAAFATSAFSTDITDGTNAFRLGCGSAGSSPYTGLVDCLGVWKRVLTVAEISAQWNGGVGAAYQDLPTSMRDMQAWYDLDDAGGSGATWIDRTGNNPLIAGTTTAAPTSAAGKR